MCELMTIAAAAFFGALFAADRRAGRPSAASGTVALAFLGAALMWAVDCAHAALEGEFPLDLSAGDAALGALVLACGVGLYAALRLCGGRRAVAGS